MTGQDMPRVGTHHYISEKCYVFIALMQGFPLYETQVYE